ncbi:hypothetical protein HMPREF0262_02876 [Clostridium sp. ATCC 29733]|nr:hypothetical protein HMPREF0262_02876 [Clostridium sp. ATCC 29733]
MCGGMGREAGAQRPDRHLDTMAALRPLYHKLSGEEGRGR